MTNMLRNYSLRAFVRGAAVLAAASATIAVAQPASQIDVNADRSDDLVMQPVSTQGLDLSTESGRKILDQRIQTAANKVCDAYTISWTNPGADFQRCFNEAVASGQSAATRHGYAVAGAHDPAG
jgi:UrcA family protein